jgi:hypothetical protein
MDVSKLLKIKGFNYLKYNEIHNIITFCYYLLNSSLNDSFNDSLLKTLAEAEQGIIIQIINDDIHNYNHIYKKVDLTEHKKKGDFAVKVINLIQPKTFAVAVAVTDPDSSVEEEFKSAEAEQNPNEVEFSADNVKSQNYSVNQQSQENHSVKQQSQENHRLNQQSQESYRLNQQSQESYRLNQQPTDTFQDISITAYQTIESKLDSIQTVVDKLLNKS